MKKKSPKSNNSHNLFLNRDPAEVGIWSENLIQAFIVRELRREGWNVAGGMEGAAKSRSVAGMSKATGQAAGEPDLRIYITGGRLIFIELKLVSGRLSDVQTVYHEMLRGLGHMVFVVYAKSPVDGWEQVKGILEGVR